MKRKKNRVLTERLKQNKTEWFIHKSDSIFFFFKCNISLLTPGTLWVCGSPSVFTPLHQIQGGVTHWTYCSRLIVPSLFPLDWLRSPVVVPVGSLAPDQWVTAAWSVHLRASQAVTTPVCEGLRGTQEKLILFWICALSNYLGLSVKYIYFMYVVAGLWVFTDSKLTQYCKKKKNPETTWAVKLGCIKKNWPDLIWTINQDTQMNVFCFFFIQLFGWLKRIAEDIHEYVG